MTTLELLRFWQFWLAAVLLTAWGCFEVWIWS